MVNVYFDKDIPVAAMVKYAQVFGKDGGEVEVYLDNKLSFSAPGSQALAAGLVTLMNLLWSRFCMTTHCRSLDIFWDRTRDESPLC